MTTFATLHPIDPGSGSRVVVRVCSSQDEAATGADGLRWIPAMAEQPVLTMSFFDGDFTSSVSPAQAKIALRLDVLKSFDIARVARFDWSGCAVTLHRMVDGALVLLAEMRVRSFAAEAEALSLDLEVDSEWADAEVLFRKYAGTTGAEGGADLKDQPKPWAFGRCSNVEPVFIDQIDNVFQVSGYGPVSAISAVYERGASFGASLGDYPNYAALVAATVPEGRWATCLAEGMFRLGAPPFGVITCDVDGDSTSGFLRRTGAIVSEVARRLGHAAKVNSDSLAALDVAVPYNVNIVISQQTTLIDLARQMAAPCNAVAALALDGSLIMPRVAFGAEQLVIDAQGRQMPPVLGVARQNTSAPYTEINMGAAQSWRVHTFDEIAFNAALIDRGLYDPATTYREGNIVQRVDKSSWVYVNPVASSGNAPPTWPTLSNAYWENLTSPASEDPAVANTNVVPAGDFADRPATGDFIGQMFTAEDTGEVFRWSDEGGGPLWVNMADITTSALRVIEPEFPVIEIKQGEAGHTGTRTVTHVAKRGTVTLTGGTWSLQSTNVPGSTITVNSSTGTVSLSGVAISGAYAIRYTHTDGVPTDLPVNVTYFPTPTGAASAKTAATTSNTGVGNTNAWSEVIALTLTGCPAGRLFFNNFSFTAGNRVTPASGTGTCEHQARLLINGSVVATALAVTTVTSGVVAPVDFSELFNEPLSVSAGTVTVSVELQRTSGTGTISTMSNSLDVSVIAT